MCLTDGRPQQQHEHARKAQPRASLADLENLDVHVVLSCVATTQGRAADLLACATAATSSGGHVRRADNRWLADCFAARFR